jgi:hypothetical protein
VALVRERTIQIERPPFVGEVSANFCGQRSVAWSVPVENPTPAVQPVARRYTDRPTPNPIWGVNLDFG